MQPPPPPAEQAKGPSWVPILLALAVLLIVSVALVFLTVGFFGSILVIVALVFGFAALHYIVWGWWLGAVIRRDVAEEEAADAKRDQDLPRT